MLKSPAPNLSIKFLRALVANRFLSPRGKEYCAEEVTVMLTEKEMNQCAKLARIDNRQRMTMIDHFKVIREFQDSMFTGNRAPRDTARASTVEKVVSSSYAPSFILPEQSIFLNDKKRADLILGTSTRIATAGGAAQYPKNAESLSSFSPDTASPQTFAATKGSSMNTQKVLSQDRKRKTMFGLDVVKVDSYSLKNIRRDLAKVEALEKSAQALKEK